MHLFSQIESAVKAAVSALMSSDALPAGLALDNITVEAPKDASHGDMATNAAMVLAKPAGMNPRAIAELLAVEVKKLPQVTGVEIAGPGFINLRLTPEFWQAELQEILRAGRGYGDSKIGGGEKVNVEYVSANPTGPMHVGHGRGAVFGDALATLLIKAGYNVTKEYYINDGGAQIDKLAETAHLRYREALGENIGEIPEGLYPGDYMKDVGRAMAAVYGDELLKAPREKWLPTVRGFAVEANMAMIKDDLKVLGIVHDVFSSEAEMVRQGKVEEALELLEKKGLVYVGVLEPPKGKAPEDWEPRPQTLFKSTEFGDDADRALKKSDGSWTYFAPDVGYHLTKVQRGFTRIINVFGADHAGYVKRISSAVQALSDSKARVEVKLCQLVKFLRGGEPMKMSKRAGTFVTVREVVDEVGKDVFRFIMLTRRNDQPLDFDFEKVMEQSKDNPVFYVQYAHARCRSVIRMAAAEMKEAVKKEVDFSRLSHPEELALIKLMCAWPRQVEAAAVAGEPHRIAFYLQELAGAFHGLWTKGNAENTLRFLQKDDIELTAARVALARALSTVIASGLMVLGVEPAEELRA